MELRNTTNWKQYWDEESKTPFAVNGEKIITFDNEMSIYEKIKFAMEKGLAGIMVWSVDTDDFQGDCSAVSDKNSYTNFPLMRSINKAIETIQDDIRRNQENIIYHGKDDKHTSFSGTIAGQFALITVMYITVLYLC